MSVLVPPRIRTDWEALLLPLLYSARDRAQLPKLKTSPSMYWSIAPSLRALAARGVCLSPVELPFIADETASNDVCFMDLCYIYMQCCQIYDSLRGGQGGSISKEGYTEEGGKKLRKVRGALEYIAGHAWLVGQNRSHLPKCLQEAHLQLAIKELTAWLAVFMIRSKCVAMWPYNDDTRGENRRKLLGCFHVLTDEEIAHTGQEDLVNFLYFRVCSDSHRKLPKEEYIRCMPCFLRKIPFASPFYLAAAKEEAMMTEFCLGHKKDVPHFSVRDMLPPSERFQELLAGCTTHFSDDAFFDPVMHAIQIKL
jgi:hypothetical protein